MYVNTTYASVQRPCAVIGRVSRYEREWDIRRTAWVANCQVHVITTGTVSYHEHINFIPNSIF
jgi:hypothetical protein